MRIFPGMKAPKSTHGTQTTSPKRTLAQRVGDLEVAVKALAAAAAPAAAPAAALSGADTAA